MSMRLHTAANIDDLRRMAAEKLPQMVFDYIDGGASDESTMRRNRHAFEHILLRPEILRDVAIRDLSVTLFGERIARPFVIGPTGLNGAYWPQGDQCIARAARKENIPFVMSTAATVTLRTMAAEAGPLRWFQLYMLKDRGLASALLDQVHANGFNVLQLTVDTAVAGRRNRDIRNSFTLPFRWTGRNLLATAMRPRWALGMLQHPPVLRLFGEVLGEPPKGATISHVMQSQLSASFTWDDLDWLRQQWPGKLVLKGVSSSVHARAAYRAGVDGLVVSNHGGRQLDGGKATIEMLPEIVDEVAGRMVILIDSGFRSGTDIAKALALGADAVQFGRPMLYGLAAGGEAGVSRALQILSEELDRAIALCGANTVAGLRGCIDAGSSSVLLKRRGTAWTSEETDVQAETDLEPVQATLQAVNRF